MGKSEVGTPKWLAKQMKMKGLQQLRWYCQACEKQCRDAHGFQLHSQSPSHVAKLESAKANVSRFSEDFETAFVSYLKSHHSKPVSANKVYNDMIRNKQHVHMNSTRFKSLTGFIRHLESKRIVDIHEVEPELLIRYIDNDIEQRKQRAEADQRDKLQNWESAEKKALQRIIETQKEADQADVRTAHETKPSTDHLLSEQPAFGTRKKIGFSLKKK